MPEKTVLARELQLTRKAAGYSAEQMAELLGVSVSAVWAWEAGRNEPPLGAIVQWARVTNVSLERLATGRRDDPRDPTRVADWLVEIFDRIVMGEDPAAAFDAVTGAHAELSSRERASLSRRFGDIREKLRVIPPHDVHQIAAELLRREAEEGLP